jgi:hypothetical protein
MSLALIASCSIVAAAATGVLAHQVQVIPEAPPVQSYLETPRQLQQLVAPIALYPDALVGQILAAAANPDQIVEADLWMQRNTSLQGLALAQAVNQQPWDSSIKTLTEFPSVLASMDKNLGWTSTLGDDYTNRQQDVLNAVQVMRQRASASGSLQTTAQQTVTKQGQSIAIAPTNPQVVYVPQYNPTGVYGAGMTPYPGWVTFSGVAPTGPGISFGYGIGSNLYAGAGFGWNSWGVDWSRHYVAYNHKAFASKSPAFMGPIVPSPNQGRSVPVPIVGVRNGSIARRSAIAMRRVSTPDLQRSTSNYLGTGTRSSAFSSFNHGGVVRTYSNRGQLSFGSGFSGGGGFRGGSGGVRRR